MHLLRQLHWLIFAVVLTISIWSVIHEDFFPAAVLAGGILFLGMTSIATRRQFSACKAPDAWAQECPIESQCQINRARGLERELTLVVDSERIRIGQELHDDLGQRLTWISISAEILASKLSNLDPGLARQADEIGHEASEAMTQVRILAHGLMPVASGPAGLRDALMELAASISKLPGIRCTFDFDDPVDVPDENVSAHLYRIAQEAVNNAIRHAHAREIDIRLDEPEGKVSLSVRDNGDGFDGSSLHTSKGRGLSTIAHRASIIHYTLEISSASGKGTVIRVTES